MLWLASQGAAVFIPVGHSPDIDLIADFGDELARVQVKTSTFHRNGRWEVRLSTMGGNQSWQGLVKRFHPSRCDRLFVHVGDGRRWYIPATSVEGGSQLQLGGPKYAEFEVEPADPLPARVAAEAAASS
jgi:PD-(D/E)XK nuclease superfamily protein